MNSNAFFQPVWSFSRKKLKNSMQYSSHRKAYTHFCRPTPHFPQKLLCPTKIIFRNCFGKYCSFKKVVKWRIFKISFPTKKVLLIFVQRRSLPLKTVMCSNKWFFTIFFRKYCFFQKICLVIKYRLPNSW